MTKPSSRGRPRIWVEERKEQLAAMWPDHTPEDIAVVMGLTPASVKCQAILMRLGPSFKADPEVGEGWPAIRRNGWPKTSGTWETIPDPDIDRGSSRYVPTYRMQVVAGPGCAARMAAEG